MPPGFCLLPKHADAFLEQTKAGGDLDPAKLSDMTSAERRAAFAEIVGDANASHINAQFESKLLLKNQQQGIQTWIEKTGGLKPEVKRDMLSRVARMEKVLEPKDLDSFLEDLAKQKLGIGVTMQEAGKISELAKTVADAKASGDWDKYVDARVNFREYMGGLESAAHKLTTPEALAAGVRAFALTWPTTIVKLSAVALSRTITTPITDAVALGIAKVFPGLAEGAPRYGLTSVSDAAKAEIAGQVSGWTDGIIDSGRMLRNKASRLDLMHSDNEVARKWFEYAGSIHGALKEPIKRAEYARSLYRRTVEAAGRGENVQDMTVKMRLSTEAFKDAQTAISMQDNVIASRWNRFVKETPDPVTGKVSGLDTFISTVLKADTPVMKAPTNIVLEASEYIGGTLTGGYKAAWGYAKGIENLQPVERDLIIRQMAKGTIGAALMTLYYFKHDLVEFGGFYQPGEHRAEGDVKEGAARIGGVDVPKQLLHNPVFDAIHFSASIARVTDHPKGEHGLGAAAGAAIFGLADELPVLHTAADFARAVHDRGKGEFLNQQVANKMVPGVVQWIAKQTDDADGVKRYPHGLGENVKATLPGLRRDVPTTKRGRK